jgi:DNA-directed RNA polymerase subunit RPC12/RpoP
LLLSGERTMAIHCPACEHVQLHHFSLFELSGSPHAFYCACGYTQAQITKRNRRYEISILTAAGDRVRLLFPFRDIWTASLLTLYSPDEGEILGFFGDCDHVEEAAVEYDSDLLQPDDFFAPEVMTRILAYLQKLAAAHKIGCTCSSPAVGIDVYPDKVELVCSHCGSAILMSAVSEEDVNRLVSLPELKMKPASYIYLGEWLKPIR